MAAAICLKDVARVAEDALVARAVRPAKAREILKPAYDLAAGKLTGIEPCDGLALLASGSQFRALALSAAVEDLAWVGERFAIRPLIPFVARDDGFWALAASQKRVRLFRGDRQGIDEVQVPGMPKSLEDVLPETHPKRNLQFHTAKWGSDVKKDAAFHGQGGAVDHEKERLLILFQDIDRALAALLRDDDRPLVFAGVDYLLPIYQSTNGYRKLLAEHVSGSPDLLSDAQLHERVFAIVKPSFERAQQSALGEFNRLLSAGAASDSVHEILTAAVEGRIKSLFTVETTAPLWGTFDPRMNLVAIHPQQTPASEDLVDRACAEVIAHGGDVYAVSKGSLEGDPPMGAIFRYTATGATTGQSLGER